MTMELLQPKYLDWELRRPDVQYRNILQQIMQEGVDGPTRQDEPCRTSPWPFTMNFDFTNGFPVITERDITAFWSTPIDELFAFINGARTEPVMRAFGVKWWKRWGTPAKCLKRGLTPGDFGPGSYGWVLHDYPSPDGLPFDQFFELVEQIKRFPDERRHMTTTWSPPYVFRTRNENSYVTIAPCHGSLVKVRILNGKLYLQMVQRSADMVVGVPSNMVQYAALTLAIASLTGFEPAGFSHILLDPHIYHNHFKFVATQLEREARIFPEVRLNPSAAAVDSIHRFRGHHFALEGYQPHPAIDDIPVAT
jgi:thymidylate synthase